MAAGVSAVLATAVGWAAARPAAATGAPVAIGRADLRVVTAPGQPRGEAPGGFGVLQLNLCNSGWAPCYRELNRGRAVAEAYRQVVALRPDLVTLNEVCRADVFDRLLPALARGWPGDRVYAAFEPARERTGGPVRCADGDEYGIGVLGRVPAATWLGAVAFGATYPDSRTPDGGTTQDAGSREERAWLCVYAVANYLGCTTHLANADGVVAANQCRYLLGRVVPALWRRQAIVPTVVGGDLNLDSDRTCLPGWWFGRRDGEVQHVLANSPPSGTRRIALAHTDHPAWLVTLSRW